MNPIHLSMTYINEQFTSTEDILNRVIPTNDEEKLWTKQHVSGNAKKYILFFLLF